MSDINIQTSVDRRDYIATIRISLIEFADKTEKQAQFFLRELLSKVLKTAVMEVYPNIQNLVDEIIHNDETELLIKNIIKEECQRIIKENLDEMMGGKR